MQVPADEWQSKMEASVKEVKKLEDHYIAKCQSLGVSILCFCLDIKKYIKKGWGDLEKG